MSDFSLYESCQRKVATYLRDGIYRSYHENPFSAMPTRIVNDLASATIDVHRRAGLGARDLELLLTCGRLRKLKIREDDVYINYAGQFTCEVLHFLKSGCNELEVLHLTAPTDEIGLLHCISHSYENVLRNSPNLKDLVSRSPFDLKSLRNCKKLRSLSLQFVTRQPLYEFLEEEDNHFLPHKYLEFLNSSNMSNHVNEIEIILRHCPQLTSIGEIETSEVLSRLHKMHFPSSELKLRHCYWEDERYSVKENRYIETHHEIRDAVRYYPVIEELDLDVNYIETISYLSHLRHLVYLNIDLICGGNAFQIFRNALQEIGFRLKHLSFKTGNRTAYTFDISILLQHCPNLESLRIIDKNQVISASSVVLLPCLQRLCCLNYGNILKWVFPQLSGCNQLTELFILSHHRFDDRTLLRFLKQNSLLNLKIAYLKYVRLTKLGFREFLLNAPLLEKVEIANHNTKSRHFRSIAREMNHKARCNENSLHERDEFFQKRYLRNLY